MIGLSIAHHSKAVGASYKGFSEHYESQVWIDLIHRILDQKGYESYIVPTGLLREKVRLLNLQELNVSLELHFNGSFNPFIQGCETLYCPGSYEGQILAGYVQNDLSLVMDTRDRGTKEGWYRMRVGGKKDYFLQYTNHPAIIIEPNFISQIQNITTHRKMACLGIVLGLIKYLERG
jgi:N-acetylmuramoyl-L-alanine amidase